MPHTTDIDLTDKDIGGLTSADALMSFFGRLGYETDGRKALTPAWAGLTNSAADTIKMIELLSQDAEIGGPYFQVVFVQPKSLTAKLRTELVRALGNKTVDYLLVLTTDFETLEFVLIDKPKTEHAGPRNHQPGGSRSRGSSPSTGAGRRRPTAAPCAVSPGLARTPSTSSPS